MVMAATRYLSVLLRIFAVCRKWKEGESQLSHLYYTLLLGFVVTLFGCQKYRCILATKGYFNISLIFVVSWLKRPSKN